MAERLAAFDHLPGDTITNNKGTTLQHSVSNSIYGIEREAAPACRRPRIVNTVVIGETQSLNRGRMNRWSESWTVDRCGAKVFYLIHFDFRGSVGTFKIEPPKT